MPIKHLFVSAKSDSADSTLVQPSNWNDDHAWVDAPPYLVDVVPASLTTTQTGVWSLSAITVNENSTVHPAPAALTSTGSQHDEVAWDLWLSEGTWALRLWHRKSSSAGIYTVKSDSSSLGTIDGYAATAVAASNDITGVDVAASGVHRISLTMATKNGSSGGYLGQVTHLSLRRTA